jgi:hypothetical protein
MVLLAAGVLRSKPDSNQKKGLLLVGFVCKGCLVSRSATGMQHTTSGQADERTQQAGRPVETREHGGGSIYLLVYGTAAGEAKARAERVNNAADTTNTAVMLPTCLALYAALCCASTASSGVSRNTGIGNQLLLDG